VISFEGCGTGLVSIVLAALLEPHRSEMQTSIVATDLGASTLFSLIPLSEEGASASAMPLIEHNVTVNRMLYSTTPVLQEVLDWEDEPGLLATRFPHAHHLIM
jgi:hypothetical protein